MKASYALIVIILNFVFLTAAPSQDLHIDSFYTALPMDLESSERQIFDKLFQKRNVNLVDATLPELVKYLNSTGVPAYLAQRELEDIGIGPDLRITLPQSSLSLVDALELVLREHELGWTIRNGSLIITSRDRAGEQLVTKLYDVANLVEFSPTWRELGNGNQKLAYEPDFTPLIGLVTGTINPDSWSDTGGAGAIGPYSTRRMRVLAVSQTYDVHFQIQAFLNRLAKIGGHAPLEDLAPAVEVVSRTGRPRISCLRSTSEVSNGDR